MTNVAKGKKGFLSSPVIERFWSKVDRRGPEECWNWTGAKAGNGYGQLWVNGRRMKAHRMAMSLAGTPVPDDRQACHTCDNPPTLSDVPVRSSARDHWEPLIAALLRAAQQ